jgi:ligand-binding SRPBCC domain-containing protein
MQFQFESQVEAPLAATFAFFADPGNLAVPHRDDRSFRLLAHRGNVEPGSETWVEWRVGPLPVVLGFRHVLCEPPRRFGESLCHGPFARFEHVHEFEPRADGSLVRDRHDIRLPWHLGGELAMRRLLARGIRATFARRSRKLAVLLGKG